MARKIEKKNNIKSSYKYILMIMMTQLYIYINFQQFIFIFIYVCNNISAAKEFSCKFWYKYNIFP